MSSFGIDFGGTFVKGAVLDHAAEVIRHAVRIPFPGFLDGLPAGRREVDTGAILEAFSRVLDLLLEAEPEPEALFLCSQMHGFVFVDRTGQPLSNFHSWQDQRATEPLPGAGHSWFQEIENRLTESDLAAIGHESRPGHAASQLFWYACNHAIPPGACACSLPDFIVAHGGLTVPVTEATMASAHGLLDLASGEWHRGVVEKLGLSLELLPKIVPTGSATGCLELRGRKVPCYSPIGDQQCALAGVRFQEGELSLNIATGSQAALRAPDATDGPFQVRPYPEGGFLRTITHIPAGRSLNALIRLLTELQEEADIERAWSVLATEAEQLADTDLVADLSFFPGAFGCRGALTHIAEGNLTAGHLFLAALKNMAENYRMAAERLSQGRTWTGIVLSGGLVQKVPRLRRLIAEAVPGVQRLSPTSEDTLTGLLRLGSLWTRR